MKQDTKFKPGVSGNQTAKWGPDSPAIQPASRRAAHESDWYQQRWGDRYQLSGDQNQKNRFENTRTGYRVVVPMSAGTGERGDYVVVDDPHSVDQASSDTERHAAVEWWNGSMATRLNDLSSAMGGGGRTRGDGRRRHAQMHPRCTPDAPKTTKKSRLPT